MIEENASPPVPAQEPGIAAPAVVNHVVVSHADAPHADVPHADVQGAEPEASEQCESFAALLEESMGGIDYFEGSVLRGRILAIDEDSVLVDAGLKSEGRVSLKEFDRPEERDSLEPGAEIEVYVERLESPEGYAVLSREKARREAIWSVLEVAYESKERVTGRIFGRVRGGFTVDISGVVAFLPGSQIDIRPTRDPTSLMNTPEIFAIVKVDRARNNIVVSRRAVMEEERAEQRDEVIAGLREGQVFDGVVKNLTDYGAFVDIGGVDGLLHVTDMAWYRLDHPSNLLSVGQKIQVQVLRFSPDTQRIGLGMKQLQADPWESVPAKYPSGTRITGRVENIADYGAFVEIEPGIKGLVHVSEMSWVRKNVPPNKIVSTSQEVEVMVLEIDEKKRRISLGLKQCLPNPWEEFAAAHPAGTIITGQVRNTTDFGLFIGLPGDIRGLVHHSDIEWERQGADVLKSYTKGQEVTVQVLDADAGKERISLGIKQLSASLSATEGFAKGQDVACTIAAVQSNGLDVTIGDNGVRGFIKRSDLARDQEQRHSERFSEGEKVDARIIAIDNKSGRLTLSIKEYEVLQEREVMKEFGSADTSARLGDILGAVLDRARADQDTSPEELSAVAEKSSEDPQASADTEKEDPQASADTEKDDPQASADTGKDDPQASADTGKDDPQASADTEKDDPQAPADTGKDDPQASADTGKDDPQTKPDEG